MNITNPTPRFGAINFSLIRPGTILRDNQTQELIRVDSGYRTVAADPGETLIGGLFYGTAKPADKGHRLYSNERYWDGTTPVKEPSIIIPGLDLVALPKDK